jgi:hypothetical protein
MGTDLFAGGWGDFWRRVGVFGVLVFWGHILLWSNPFGNPFSKVLLNSNSSCSRWRHIIVFEVLGVRSRRRTKWIWVLEHRWRGAFELCYPGEVYGSFLFPELTF